MIVVVAPCLFSRVSEYGALTSLCLGGPRNTTAFSHIYPVFSLVWSYLVYMYDEAVVALARPPPVARLAGRLLNGYCISNPTGTLFFSLRQV